MLVHKATMGVLEWIWDGKYVSGPDGSRIPAERRAVLSDLEHPEDWWEVPDTGTLGRRIRKYYPFLRPVVGENGDLVYAVILYPETDRITGLHRQAEHKRTRAREAARRGYKKAGCVRPLGVMPFLTSGGRTRKEMDG